MRRLLLVLAVLGACVGAPAAHASTGSTYAGRCHLTYLPDEPYLFGNERQAVMYAAVALYAADPAAGTVSAEVTCELRAPWYGTTSVSGHGTTAVVVAGRPPYVPWDTSAVSVCTIVDFDDATPTAEECRALTTLRLPPDEVYDAVERHVDPLVCRAFAALAPGVPGVDVTTDGDVYVGGEWVWDCAPYGDPAPPSGSRSTYAGGCHWDTLTTEAYGGYFHGSLTAAVALYAPDAAANPVSGTVTCSVRVNGADVPSATASGSGTGVVAFRQSAGFVANEADVVELCTRVVFTDGTPAGESCERDERTQVPPQEVFDALRAPDAVVCPAFAALHPSVPGVNEQGDVYVADEPLWDCPPYDIWP